MEIIDAQLHDIGPSLNWDDTEATKGKVLSEVILAWMDAVGVDVGLLNFMGAERALELTKSFPKRFKAVVTIYDPARADIDDYIQQMSSDARVCAVRALMGMAPRVDAATLARLGVKQDAILPEGEDPNTVNQKRMEAGYFDALFEACERYHVPLFAYITTNLKLLSGVAEKYPKLRLIIDHFGIPQPPFEERDEPTWQALDDLTALAKYPNVAVKMTGAPAYSDEPFPYRDVWNPMRRLVDAFSAERLMWASDISRFQGRMGWTNEAPQAREPYPGRHNYAQSLYLFLGTDLFSAEEKEWVLGRSARTFLELPS